MKTQFDLTKEAVLVDLNVGARGLSARSRKLSEEAAEKHDADRSSVSGTVQKLLNRDLKGVTKALNAARDVFKQNTLPWDNGSWRLCPLPLYDTLRNSLAETEENLKDEVNELVSRYDSLAQDYKTRVKDLADEVKFPTRDELAGNFRLSLSEMPIANPSGIFLNHMTEEELGGFRNRVQDDIKEKLATANEDLVYRMIEQVSKLKAQVSKDPKDTKFHKSLIKNIEKQVEILPSLNLTNDPKIDKLIARIKRDLASVDINDLKNDGQVRKSVESDADSILRDLQAL